MSLLWGYIAGLGTVVLAGCIIAWLEQRQQRRPAGPGHGKRVRRSLEAARDALAELHARTALEGLHPDALSETLSRILAAMPEQEAQAIADAHPELSAAVLPVLMYGLSSSRDVQEIAVSAARYLAALAYLWGRLEGERHVLRTRYRLNAEEGD